MCSEARIQCEIRLGDVDELIAAHRPFTSGTRGAPSVSGSRRLGSALIRGGYVLLYAILEAFVEDLFKESCRLIYPGLSDANLKLIFKETSEKFNTATPTNIDKLYLNVGLPFITSTIRWQKKSNDKFKSWLESLVQRRGSIAHGKCPGVQKRWLEADLKAGRKFVSVFESVVSQRIEELIGTAP